LNEGNLVFNNDTLQSDKSFCLSITNEKYGEYLTERFRKSGSSTTKWGLLFFIALLYTLTISIIPRAQFISNSVDVIENINHFESLTSNMKKERHSFIHSTRDSLLIIQPNLDSLSIIQSELSSNRHFSQSDCSLVHHYTNLTAYSDNLRKAIQKANEVKHDSGKRNLKLLLDSASKLTGKAKKNLKDSIRKYFLPIDIFITMSDNQKQKASRQKDSLLNHADISFNVPEVHTLDFGFRIGLVVWMVLLLTLLLYLFTTRLSLIEYLKKIYDTERTLINENDWERLDLQIPFWLAPIQFKNGPDKRIFQKMVGWRFTLLNNIAGIVFLVLILCLQFYVGWLLWHVSVMRFFESNVYKIIGIVLLFVSVFVFLLWLSPVVFSSDFAEVKYIDFKRREIIMLGASSLVFLLAIPSIAKYVPLIGDDRMRFIRKKRRKPGYKTNVSDGFYVYKKRGLNVVYFFSDGQSPSMKSINEREIKNISKKWRRTEILSIIDDPDISKYHIPYWPYILEKQAYYYAIKDDYINAVKIVLFSLAYSDGTGSRYIRNRLNTSFSSIEILQKRLISFLAGLILRAQIKLSEPDKAKLASIIASKQLLIPSSVLNKDFMTFYNNNEDYIKKWQRSKKLNWHLAEKKSRHRVKKLNSI
jgi:hypothetical protein